MDDSTREHKASEIARSAAIDEAHEQAAFAAEAGRREAREKELPHGAVQAGQTAYDSVYQQIYEEVYEGLREITLRLLNCYDRQLHFRFRDCGITGR